jgi:hypothetical protein
MNDSTLDLWVNRTAEATIKRLRSQRVETTIPAGMAVGECHFSRTGFALWHTQADGSLSGCTCRPYSVPPPPR